MFEVTLTFLIISVLILSAYAAPSDSDIVYPWDGAIS